MISNLPVGNEAALLFGCARGSADVNSIQELADRNIDWGAFLALAEAHNLSSLCCRRLEQACPDLVPHELLQTLRRHLRVDTERNLFLTGELLRILDHLAAGGIQALAFKGPVLGWWVYGHPGLRRFSDLDLLVAPRQLERAIGLFTEIGYSAEAGRDGKPKVIPSAGQISLFRSAARAEVDLHWNLAPRAMGLSLDARSLLPRAMTVMVGGKPVLTFGEEDQFLLCAFHGGKHGWTNLAWLADLSGLMETRRPDWPRLLAEARRKALSRALFVGLRLVNHVFGTALPPEIQSSLERDKSAAALAAEARDFLLNSASSPAIVARELRYEWRLTEGLGRKAAYLWHKITEPSPQDWELPKTARPYRLARKYAFRLAGLH